MKNKILLVFTIIALASVGIVQAAPPERDSIVDVAIAVNSEGPFAGSFDTLITAVVAAGLDSALDGKKQFTVFAPTDSAFEALGLNPENVGDVPVEALKQILLYHVAHGRLYAEDVIEKNRIRTLQGGFLFVDGTVLTDTQDRQSNIIVTDVTADNGIIHAIDTVVLPFAL